MAWHKGYLYRSYRACGRVCRQYLGRGPAAEAAAAEEQKRREELQQLRELMRHDEAEWAEGLANLRRFTDAVEALFNCQLTLAGFHLHKRGEWRLRHRTENHHDTNDR